MNKLSIYNQMWYDIWNDMESALYATMDKQIGSRRPYDDVDDLYYLHMTIREMIYNELDSEG